MKLTSAVRFVLSVFVIALLAAAFAPGAAQAQNKSEPTIVDIALAVNAETGEFSTLIAALQAADLVDMFDGKGQYTVFAPTDAAFAALGITPANVASVPGLANILAYHVTEGRRLSQSLLPAKSIEMLNSDYTYSSFMSNSVYIIDNSDLTANAKVTTANINASNGVIHIINQVLLP